MNVHPDSDPTSEALRQALAAEAAGVQPDPQALQAIQQRTTADSPSGLSVPPFKVPAGAHRRSHGGPPSWVLGTLGAAVATAAVITAVVVVGDRSGNPSRTPAAGPATTVRHSERTPPTDPNARAGEVTVYYVSAVTAIDDTAKNTSKLYPERHITVYSTVTGAVHEFLTSTPIDSDYTSGWPPGVDVASISEAGRLTTIALTGPASLPDEPLPFTYARPVELPVQAMLSTAGIEGSANFTYNGKPLDSIFGIATPVNALPLEETRAWVSITSPVEGQTVDNPVTVTGSANVFEANVNWDLLNDNGQVVDSGYATAGFMEWKPFTIDLGMLDPGTYTIRAFEASPKDGRPTFIDDKTFTVS